MQAVVLHEHGGLDKLTFESAYRDPVPAEGEVLLRVRASSLNYHDVFTVRGMPGIKVPLPVIIGLDVAGEVLETGPGVTGWKAGDRVLVDPIGKKGLMGEMVDGGLAEKCVAAAEQLIRIPEGVSFADAAALPVAYGTAHRMLFTHGGLKAGERILILGASGGVGTCCVLLAKMAGAEVIAAASTEQKMERLRALGADHTINYTTEDFAKWVFAKFGKPHRRTFDGGVDVLVNYNGGDTWVPSLRALKRGGRLLTCGATAGFDPKEDLRFIWTFELQILGSNSWARSDLEALLAMIAQGKMKPSIDRVLPLREAHEGVRLLQDREVFGKVIVSADA